MRCGRARRRRKTRGCRHGAPEQGIGMDGLRDFLGDLKRRGYAQGDFVGFLNVLIGGKIQARDGTIVSNGLPWRTVAELLKRFRWEKVAVRELGLDPAGLPPRDRERYWYLAISRARVDSAEATAAGDRFA